MASFLSLVAPRSSKYMQQLKSKDGFGAIPTLNF